MEHRRTSISCIPTLALPKSGGGFDLSPLDTPCYLPTNIGIPFGMASVYEARLNLVESLEAIPILGFLLRFCPSVQQKHLLQKL